MSKGLCSVSRAAALAATVCTGLCSPAWAGQATTRPHDAATGAAPDVQTPGQAGAGPASLSPWQWVSLGLGTALVAGGVTSMVLGFSDDSKADKAWSANPPTLTQQQYDDLRDQASTKKTIGYILTGVGGAALIVGGVLLALELLRHEASGDSVQRDWHMAFGLAPLPDGGAASLAVGF